MKTENEKTILKLKRQIRETEKKNLELDLEIEETKVIKSLKKELFKTKNYELIEVKDSVINGAKVSGIALFKAISIVIVATFTFLVFFLKEVGKASDRYEAQVNNRNPLPGFLK